MLYVAVRCVAKNHGENQQTAWSFLFSLGSHSKQSGDQRDLSSYISFAHALYKEEFIITPSSLQHNPVTFMKILLTKLDNNNDHG